MGLKDMILDMVPGDAARKVGNAIAGANDGHTTSGLDSAMQAHADKLHPVNPPDFYPRPKNNPNKGDMNP